MKNDSAKIVFIEGPHDQLEIPLAQNSLYVGRRDGTTKQQADIDLTPDFKVSRKHARLCFKNSTWWIQDTRSKHGTLVQGKEIKGLTMPTKLSPGVPVKTGNTVWMIAPSNHVQVRVRDLTIGFTKVSAVNYALYHCGIPIISDLVISNKGTVTSPPLMLTISIKGYSQPWHKHFDPLAPGGKFALNKIHLNLDYERLEGNEGRKRARLNLQFNDMTIFTEEIHILGFFEWATDQVCRKSLACFVQPSHPVVQNIVLDAVGYLKEAPGFTHLLKTGRSDKAECALRALYECLKEKYQIHYVLEPVSFEAEAQVIRPIQRVMPETWKGRGKGTCIDLTLLLASCLENIRLQPLIIFGD